ncbi:MAG: tellurium resistance protein [Paracoccaceae bacterium]
MQRPRPAPFVPRPKLFHQTPPAIFPSVMGLLGLGLAWRSAGIALSITDILAQLILGAVMLLYVFCLAAYAAKVVRRPGVVGEDAAILPGRTGLSAMILSLLLLAVALGPFRPGIATVLLAAGLALQGIFAVGLIAMFLHGPVERRRVNPAWHLHFVGFIIGGLAAATLGHDRLALAIFWPTLAVAILIWGASLRQLLSADVPAPLRPMLAIHLAPAALLGLVAQRLAASGQLPAFLPIIFGGLCLLLLAVFALRSFWMTAAGFSPLWGAFTFPLAASASLFLRLDGPWIWPGIVALTAASGIVPLIAIRIFKLWAKGDLGPRTNAAKV